MGTLLRIWLVMMWVVAWLLTVPLFHVHPDTAHYHSEAGPHHGGIAHTVFSRDLIGEFGSSQTHSQEAIGLSTHSSCPLQDSSELGFCLHRDPSDRNFFKFLTAVEFIAVVALPSPEIADLGVREEKSVLCLLFTKEPSSRAPPSVVL